MSRNKDRVGGVQNKNVDTPPPSVMKSDSEGFSFVLPTEFVELPSKGRFYPEGHPLHGEDSLEIKQMTAKEEDLLTSRTLLKKGVALDRMVQSIIVDKRINCDHLLVGDKNAIIIAARVSGYGNEYATKVSCPSCGTNQDYTFDLNSVKVYCGDEIDALSITDNENGTFEVELPRTKVNVTFRLLTGNDEKSIVSATQLERKNKNPERVVTRQLSNIIVAVNGDDSIEARKYLIDNMPSLDSRHLRASFKLASPNIDMTHNFECSECTYEQLMEVPLTADFFWPDR